MDWEKVIENLREQAKANNKFAATANPTLQANEADSARNTASLLYSLAWALESGLKKDG